MPSEGKHHRTQFQNMTEGYLSSNIMFCLGFCSMLCIQPLPAVYSYTQTKSDAMFETQASMSKEANFIR